MMENAKIVIVDDNVTEAKKVKTMISPFFENREIEIQPTIDEEYFIENNIDLVFLNEKTNSFKKLLEIRFKQTYKMDIIIFTENDICIDDMELKFPIYLVKKSNEDRELETVIKTIKDKWAKNSTVLKLFAGYIKLDDILYVQSSNNTIVYHLIDDSVVHEWKTLNHCTERLKSIILLDAINLLLSMQSILRRNLNIILF